MKILNQIDKDKTPATDRALAIQGSAMIEHALEIAICRHLRKDLDPTVKASLFGLRESGPFSSFGACVLVGYALGEYGPITLNDLKTITEIRNSFAHSTHPIDFTFPPVVTLCESLQLCRHHPNFNPQKDARDQFKAFAGQFISDMTLDIFGISSGEKITRIPPP